MNIETMTGAELVAQYNKLTGLSVKRFSNRATGIRRLKEAQQEQRRVAVVDDGPREKATTPPAPAEAAKGAPTVNVAQKVEQRSPRPGSKRAMIVESLGRGAPVGDYASIWGGRITCPKRIAAEVRFAASELGVGVVTGADGRWRLA